MVKGLSLVISFTLVPIVLGYIDPVEYGIWLTISSFIHWFGFFNLGLGNGLRNKLTIALANNDFSTAKKLVSTTYALIFIISLSLFLVFLLSNKYLDYTNLFNTSETYADELRKVVFVVFSFFLLRFVLQLITSVVNAFQLPALSSIYQFSSSLLSLCIIYILTRTTSGSLFYISLIYSMSPVIMLLLFSVIFYSTKFKDVSPSLAHVDFRYSKDLLGLGILFLINRINGIILFTTDNMIITQISGPEDVTPYSLTHKYFGLVTMLFEIITLPLWSAFTDAYEKNEFEWIRNIIHRIRKLWFLVAILLVIMIPIGKYVFKIWLGDKVEYSFSLALLMAASVAIVTYVNVFSRFINGVSKIRLATYISVFQAIINIPLSLFLASSLNLGVNGVILATVICLIPPTITHPIQTWKIINHRDKGIWAK